jgi:hypothetical protein
MSWTTRCSQRGTTQRRTFDSSAVGIAEGIPVLSGRVSSELSRVPKVVRK